MESLNESHRIISVCVFSTDNWNSNELWKVYSLSNEVIQIDIARMQLLYTVALIINRVMQTILSLRVFVNELNMNSVILLRVLNLPSRSLWRLKTFQILLWNRTRWSMFRQCLHKVIWREHLFSRRITNWQKQKKKLIIKITLLHFTYSWD